MKLSPTMLDAIELMKNNGGVLMRYPGGYWMKPGLDLELDDLGGAVVPIKKRHVGTLTIDALIKRGVVEVIGTRTAKHNRGTYPHAVRLKEVSDDE